MKPKELERAIRRGEIDTVLAVLPDMQGRLMGKRVTGRHFLKEVARGGMHACAYLLTVDIEMEPLPGFDLASWKTGYQDFWPRPDMTTLRRIPWIEKTALVLCDIVDEEGRPVEVSPRRILQKQTARARKMGFTPFMASELEFYLFRETYESARAKNYHRLEPASAYLIDYQMLQTTRDEPLIRAIRNGMEGAGIPVESSKGEWGPGQHEINLEYAEAVEMADRHVIYKNGAREIAAAAGAALTFMAKYDAAFAGSSCHIHSSLWKGGRNAFSSRPLFDRWLGGLLAGSRELSLFTAPTVNSYKRYQSASFAPTRIAWSHDNRTVGFRVVGSGDSLRVENRLPGADANPYLAFASTLAAGLHGIEKKIDPPAEFKGNAYESDRERVPRSLPEAIEAFESSALARAAFGEAVVKHYVHAARLEQAAFERAVTCWERERYFERI